MVGAEVVDFGSGFPEAVIRQYLHGDKRVVQTYNSLLPISQRGKGPFCAVAPMAGLVRNVIAGSIDRVHTTASQ